MSSFRFVLCVVMIFFLSGFKHKVKQSGYVSSIQDIEVGLAKEQVVSLMGTPSVVSDLSGNWYYINTTTDKNFLGLNKTFSAKIVQISFRDGKVEHIRTNIVPKQPLFKINPDSSIVNEEGLKAKIISALKHLNPSL